MIKLVYDLKLRRPGCVLIQAALGGSPEAANQLPSDSWLINITDDMRLYELTDEQFTKLMKYHDNIELVYAK